MNRNKFEKKYFDTNYKNNYDLKNPERKLRSYLSSIREFKKRGKLLDIGCAFGAFAKLASQNFEVVGIDISSYGINKAKSQVKGVRFIRTSLQDYQTKAKFNVVTCFDTLEHLDALEASLKKIRKLLLKGGTLALVVPVYDGPFGFIVRLLDKDPTHVHKRSRKFWERVLKKHGFKVILKQGLFRYLLFGKYIFVESKSLYKFSPAIFIMVQ